MNGMHTQTGWFRQDSDSWEKMINGTTYLIEREEGMFHLYRLLGWERIDCAKNFDAVAQSAYNYEGVDNE